MQVQPTSPGGEEMIQIAMDASWQRLEMLGTQPPGPVLGQLAVAETIEALHTLDGKPRPANLVAVSIVIGRMVDSDTREGEMLLGSDEKVYTSGWSAASTFGVDMVTEGFFDTGSQHSLLTTKGRALLGEHGPKQLPS